MSFGLHVEMEGSVLRCWRPVGLCDLRGIASPGFSQSTGLCELLVNTDPARYYAMYVTVPMGTVKKPSTCLHRNSHVHQIPYQAACPTRRPKLQTPTVFVGMQLAIPTQLKIRLAAARILNPKLAESICCGPGPEADKARLSICQKPWLHPRSQGPPIKRHC